MSISKIEQIKKLLFGDVPPVPASVQAPAAAAFTDYTMLDGTTCQIDNLAVGGKVTCAGIPATEGDMTLQDGTMISVDKNGIITNVTPAPAQPVAPGQPVMPGMPTDYTSQFADIESKIKSLKDQFDADLAKAIQKMEKQEEIAKQMFVIVEELSKLPAGKPAEVPSGKAVKMQAQEDRLKQLQANIAKIKATA
jgi:hypothetical protein